MFMQYIDPHGPYAKRDGHDFGVKAIDLYDSEIAYTDHEIGRFLDGLKKSGLADRTIVVLFADHGESFDEHNLTRHGTALYQHQIHVPVMMRVPGLAPRDVSQWVSLADLAPTMTSLLGVTDGYRRLGRDLAPLLLGADAKLAGCGLRRSSRPATHEAAVERASGLVRRSQDHLEAARQRRPSVRPEERSRRTGRYFRRGRSGDAASHGFDEGVGRTHRWLLGRRSIDHGHRHRGRSVRRGQHEARRGCRSHRGRLPTRRRPQRD